MNDEIREILLRITALEDELIELVEAQQQELRYRIEGTRVRFERSISEMHKRFKTGLVTWLLRSELRNIVSAPVIYALIVPFAALDLAVTLYQATCFPLYRVPRVQRRRHIVLDRHQLRYLNSIEKLNCAYCGYASGVLTYAREVAARTEQYWCPIKHARKIRDQHRRYHAFADFGDAESYPETLRRLRQELAAERAAQPDA